jgi:hypothetical protein
LAYALAHEEPNELIKVLACLLKRKKNAIGVIVAAFMADLED